MQIDLVTRARALNGLPVPEGTLDRMYADGVGGSDPHFDSPYSEAGVYGVSNRDDELGAQTRYGTGYPSSYLYADYGAARAATDQYDGFDATIYDEQMGLYQVALEQAALTAGSRRTRAALGMVSTEEAVMMNFGQPGMIVEPAGTALALQAELVPAQT